MSVAQLMANNSMDRFRVSYCYVGFHCCFHTGGSLCYECTELSAKWCLKLNSNLSLPAPYQSPASRTHWFQSLPNKRCFPKSEFSSHIRISLCSEQPKKRDTKPISLQYVDECMASETLSLFACLIICF